jgi:hypothetical protein
MVLLHMAFVLNLLLLSPYTHIATPIGLAVERSSLNIWLVYLLGAESNFLERQKASHRVVIQH